MARLGSLLLVLLFIGYWCPYEISADTCVPTVKGEPFVEFMKNKNCEVDEKLLKLFNPESFNETVSNKSNTNVNFMCIGFMDALSLAPESLCFFDPLSDIPDSDFCSSTKMMTTLGKIVNGSVFDKRSNIVIVSNYTIHLCKMLCSGYNELCWAFGTIARVVLKESSIPTTEPATTTTTTTTTEPASTDPTTVSPTIPILSIGTDTDIHGDDPITPAKDTNNDAVQSAYDAKNSSSDGNTGDSQAVPIASHNDEDQEGPSDDGGKMLSGSISTGDNKKITGPNDKDQEGPSSSSDDDNSNNNTTVNITDVHHNTTTAPENSTTPTNATASEEVSSVGAGNEDIVDNDDQNVGVDHDSDDQNGGVYHDNGDQNDVDYDVSLDDSDHNDVVKPDNNDHKGGADHIDDDDDDDGYSYWHFAAILLFILFLGVAGYLASHNRKKVL